jgi:hypothetical protein
MRLMVALPYLKHAYNESDVPVVERWAQDVYYQFFSGQVYIEPRLPCGATQIGRFRRVLGEAGVEQLHEREGRTLRRRPAGYAHAKQFQRLKRVLRRQRTIMGTHWRSPDFRSDRQCPSSPGRPPSRRADEFRKADFLRRTLGFAINT